LRQPLMQFLICTFSGKDKVWVPTTQGSLPLWRLSNAQLGLDLAPTPSQRLKSAVATHIVTSSERRLQHDLRPSKQMTHDVSDLSLCGVYAWIIVNKARKTKLGDLPMIGMIPIHRHSLFFLPRNDVIKTNISFDIREEKRGL
jgi:hypothetical protein